MVRTWNKRWFCAPLLVGAMLASSCGGAASNATGPGTNGNTTTTGTTTSTASTSNAINVDDDLFDPSATTVPVGTTVTWTWIGSVGHNVTFDDGPQSPTQTSGKFTRAFTVAGTYKYHCTIHGLAMSGTVTVQ